MIRREFLKRLLGMMAAAAWPLSPGWTVTSQVQKAASTAQPFRPEQLRETARQLAQQPYQAPTEVRPSWLAALNWDDYQSLHEFDPDRALWADRSVPFQARFFHLGLYFHSPVALYQVADGQAWPIPFSPNLFHYGERVRGKLPDRIGDLGLAGFRVSRRDDWERDWFSFLGASYFRAVGSSKQYGLSARGLAVDTGMDQPEEFPRFRAFWLERPIPEATTLVLHALLDSPSITGAYHFAITPGEPTTMTVETHLFPRRPIAHLGIAPITSMFQCGENDRRVADDYRPEIHDSDGLALWTGSGEWIWRPLLNPHYRRVNGFKDQHPRGFGLLQRDRNPDHYQDYGAFYHRRPSLWVEMLGDWGQGWVQLVELPTADETFDNIVAFWHPAEVPQPGQALQFNYRLYWGAHPPFRPALAEVIATRTGVGGVPGQPPAPSLRKFVLDFQGSALARWPQTASVEPVVTASRGMIKDVVTARLQEQGVDCWRCHFDLEVHGREPVDLRCFLRNAAGDALSETWLYQWSPPPPRC